MAFNRFNIRDALGLGGGGFGPGYQSSISPRSSFSLRGRGFSPIRPLGGGRGPSLGEDPMDRAPRVTRPTPAPASTPQPALKPSTPRVTSPTAPSAPAAPQFGSGQGLAGSPSAPSVSRPAITGAPTAPSTGTGSVIPPHLAAAMATPGGVTTQFGGAPTPARPTPQQAPGTITPAAGQFGTPSAPPQVTRPVMSPLAAATPMQTPGGSQVFRRGSSGLLGAAGGLLEGGLGVPGTRGTQQVIPSELLALLMRRR